MSGTHLDWDSIVGLALLAACSNYVQCEIWGGSDTEKVWTF